MDKLEKVEERQSPSRKAAKECSPRRKPWVKFAKMAKAPEWRKKH